MSGLSGRGGTVRVVEQLSVFLANEPGALASLCDGLAEREINIYGLTVSDTVDHAVVRMVVSDPGSALRLFEERDALAVANDVLMIENDNRPGSLSTISRSLAEQKVNIEYAYLASMPRARRGLLILRVNHTKRACKVLQKLFD